MAETQSNQTVRNAAPGTLQETMHDVAQAMLPPERQARVTKHQQESHQALWQQVQAQVMEHLSPASYQTWVRPLQLRSVSRESDSEASITLVAASEFSRGYVKNNFAKALAMAFKACLPCERLTVHWEVDANLDSAPKNGGATPNAHPAQAEADAESILNQQEAYRDPENNRPWTPRTLTSGLQPRYTFEQFVTGSFNHFAHAAAQAIAEQPGIAYNPFFIHGTVGLGKTHLVQAIGHHVLRHHPHLSVRYVTTETFTNDLIHALTTKKMDAFRDKYRKIDVLIIDDIQFLEGKEKTQEEVFHTFNALHGLSKQVILTSDRPPKALARLEERLVSRFEWGLIVDVQIPDLEARKAILRKKAEREGLTLRFHLEDEVLTYLAEKSPNNIRELEGHFNKLAAKCMLEEAPFSMSTVESIFGTAAPVTQRLDEELILEVVSQRLGVPVKELKSAGRSKEVAHARQVATYVCRELLETSFPKLGKLFNRKHSTMLYGYEKLKEQAANDVMLKKQVTDIINKCKHQCY